MKRKRFDLHSFSLLSSTGVLFGVLHLTWLHAEEEKPPRPGAREAGVVVGTLPPGKRNAITDVEGVLVGQVSLREGTRLNTGVTAIRPHPGNLYDERVPAAIHVGNGFGKLIGVTQVRELG